MKRLVLDKFIAGKVLIWMFLLVVPTVVLAQAGKPLSGSEQKSQAPAVQKLPEPKVEAPDTDKPQLPEPTPGPTVEKQPESPPPAPIKTRLTSREIRGESEFSVFYTFSPLTTWVPWKHGPQATWILSEQVSLEAAYFAGSISTGVGKVDLGEIKEKQISVSMRYYPGNSFNWIFGGMYHSTELSIGNDIISRLSGGSLPSNISLIKVATLDATVGLGNRWQFESGFTLNFDWFLLNIPLSTVTEEAAIKNYMTNESDKKTVDDAVHYLKKIPTITTIKVGLGMTF